MENINRIEIINWKDEEITLKKGRNLVLNYFNDEDNESFAKIQDNGKTLKLFIKEKANEKKELDTKEGWYKTNINYNDITKTSVSICVKAGSANEAELSLRKTDPELFDDIYYIFTESIETVDFN